MLKFDILFAKYRILISTDKIVIEQYTALFNTGCNVGSNALRLVGSRPHEGRLEVHHNGVWGTVCDDSFDDNNARVACYVLGYGSALRFASEQ